MKKNIFLASLIILAMSVSFVSCQSSEKTEKEVSGRPNIIKETIKSNQNQANETDESDNEMEAELNEDALDQNENQDKPTGASLVPTLNGNCMIVCTNENSGLEVEGKCSEVTQGDVGQVCAE